MSRKTSFQTHVTTVLFDLDDTLLDTFKARVSALDHVFKCAGLDGLEAEKIERQFRGVEIKGILSRCGASRDDLDILFYEYRKAYWTKENQQISIFTGIQTLLEGLVSSGIKLGVVTQKGRSFDFEGHAAGAIVELEKTGISGFFPVVVGLEDVKKTKPDPEGIKKALGALAATHQGTVFVGDSVADMTAAHSAGCISCLATWGTSDHHDYGADIVVNSPAELLEIIMA